MQTALEDEANQARDTERKRAVFQYTVDLSDALRKGESLDGVGVPDDVPKEDASTSLYSWRLRKAASEGRNLDEVQVPKDIRKSEAVRAMERERRESLVEDRSRRTTTERIVKANAGWASTKGRSTAFENDVAEMDAGAGHEAPLCPPDDLDETNPGPVNEGRGAVGYDHGYDAEIFYLGLALHPNYVEGCLERIGEDYPDDEAIFRDLWEDEAEKDAVLEILKVECEILPGRPQNF